MKKSSNTHYHGHTIDLVENQFGWITIIDGKDVAYEQLSDKEAHKTGTDFIDAQDRTLI